MAFDYYSPVTINAGQVPSAQTNFPVLISVTDSRFKTVANGGHVKNANGYDIRPYSDAPPVTALTYELERYNGITGELIMWVKRSSVSDGLITYLAYGDTSLNTDGSSATTWSNGFISVYHLKDGTTLSVSDSTGTNNGTNHGVTAAPGKIDGAGGFASVSSQYISAQYLTSVARTVSVWVNATSFPNAYNAPIASNPFVDIFVKSTGKIACYAQATGTVSYDGTGSHTLSPATWYLLTLTYSSSTGLIGYVNSSSDGIATANGALITGTSASMDIGQDPGTAGRFWNGVLDEVRISSVVRSSDWITTEYNNQSSPSTFETLGDEFPPPVTPSEPVIIVPDEHRGGARGWKKRLLDEKLWMDKQDEMFLKIANEDDLEVVHVLTDFLSRV